MSYSGNDRRIHKVFITRNTEYHVRKDMCVAVRDRRSGQWLKAHLALQNRVHGGLKFHLTGGVTPSQGTPRLGESLFFHASGRDLVTSAIVGIERPPRDIIGQYHA